MPKGKKNKNGRPKKDVSVMDQKPDQHDRILARVESLQAPGTLRNLGTLICPQAMRTRLKFTQRLNLTSTSGIYVATTWSMNSLFDPYTTGVGGQPEGFDEWMAMYTAFRVVSSKITVKSGSTGATSATGSFWMIVVPKNISGTFTTMSDAASAPYAVSKNYQQGSPAITLTQTMTVATVVGVPPIAILSESGFSGTASSNPSGTTFWDVYVEAADTASTVTANAIIEVEYVADFYDKDNFAISIDEKIKKMKAVRDARTAFLTMKRDAIAKKEQSAFVKSTTC